MKTAIAAVLLVTAIASPSSAGEIWQPGMPLTSDNLLSYVFAGRGQAKLFTEADQRLEEATRPMIIESRPRSRTTSCYIDSGRGARVCTTTSR